MGYVRVFALGCVLARRCENETLNKQSRDIPGGEHVGKVDSDVGTGEYATQLLNTGDETEEEAISAVHGTWFDAVRRVRV